MIIEYTNSVKKSGLTFGKNYKVIEVTLDLLGAMSVRVIRNDGNTPIIVNEQDFKIVDNDLSSTWKLYKDENGSYLRPPAWSYKGFWEDYFNGNPQAEKVLEKELERVMRE